VLCDLGLPDMSGLDTISQIKRLYPHIPVIAAAGARDLDLAREALRRGAADFIRKADAPERIAQLVRSTLGEARATIAAQERAEMAALDPFHDLVSASPKLRAVIDTARQAAKSDIPVLLKGESGVGKERFARAIHQSSARRSQPFVAVNCGAIPENLVESILFGHERGAFTGAVESTMGKFGEADGGTLFLDELGELKPDIQVRLLRAVQEKEIQPVGGKMRPVDVRILSATNRNLELAVVEQRFREDLFYRLNVFPIEIPPLRERGTADISALVEYFARYFADRECRVIRKVSDAAMALLVSYDWPGNVRQLENAVYRAVVLASEDMLRVEDFVLISNALHQRQLQQQKAGSVPPSAWLSDRPKLLSDALSVNLMTPDGRFKKLEQMESEVLMHALGYFRWHITQVAQALGITRATVYKKMKRAGIHDPRSGVPYVGESVDRTPPAGEGPRA
jgi:DNA-binding NtrC family response regulator